MTSTPAGWYDDGHGATRWWDGAQWTEQVQPVQSTPPAEEATAAPADDAATASVEDAVPRAESAPASVEDAPPPVPPTPGGVPPMPPVPTPGTYTQTAAVLPPAAPARRGWVLPVILGGAFLVLVILGIVFIPMLVQSFTASRYSADENAAIAVVDDYDEAWQEADCEAFEATTTEQFRIDETLPDCAAFEEAAAGFDDATDDYEIEVIDVTSESGVIMVRTDETFTSYVDEDGSAVPGYAAVSTIDYTVVEADGQWRIDDTVYVE